MFQPSEQNALNRAEHLVHIFNADVNQACDSDFDDGLSSDEKHTEV